MSQSGGKPLNHEYLEATCAEQVEDLHRLFVHWFRGTRPLEELREELQQRLLESFSHVAPNGQFLSGRDVLLGHLLDKYGCYSDRIFEIDIFNVKLVWTDGTKSLVTYEEWQSWQADDDATENSGSVPNPGGEQTQQFGRLSTCLLEKIKSRTYRWIHVHETWLEEEAPSPVARKASEARAYLLTHEASVSELEEEDDTVMTGPRQPASPMEEIAVTNGSINDDASPPASPVPPKKSEGMFAALLMGGKSNKEPEKSKQPSSGAMGMLAALGLAMSKEKKQDNESPAAQADTGKPEKIKRKLVGDDVLFFEPDGGVEEEGSSSDSEENGDSKPSGKKDQGTADTEDTAEDMSPQEQAFLEASKGILVWEEEEEALVKPEDLKDPVASAAAVKRDDLYQQQRGEQGLTASLPTSPIHDDVSKKRHVSVRLEQYAKPMMWEGALVGISIAGFDIGTSQGPIADEAWYREHGAIMEDMAQSKSIPKPKRRICLPEMVFPIAHVAFEGYGVWMSWDATAALESWAQCHSMIAVLSRIPWQGVSVIKTEAAASWEHKRKHVGVDENAASIFHYDWTYSTPYCGTVEGGEWVELDESGMRMELLTDQSVPILLFDEVVLYEDDLHDNGQVQYSVKLRVMPSCAYILARLFVRVDNIVIRLRESRVLVDFFGIKPQIYRDVSWRECVWENLESNGLPTEVRPWHHTGRDTAAWNQLVKQLPEVDPPSDVIFKHAVLEY